MLSVYKKNTIFGRNINSNLPLYYDNIVVEGETTQETRSGKNLFNTNTSFIDNEYYSCTNNKITVLQYDGRSWGNIYDFALKPNTTYTLSTENTGRIYIGKDKAFFAYVDDNKFTFTTSNTGSTQIKFLPPSSNNTYPFAVGYVQLELGSTATDYEPYGQMPSPDYPSELVSVGYENLINKERIILGYFRISDGTYLASTSATYKSTELIPISPSTKYYSNVVAFSSSAVGVTYWNDSGTFISGSALSSNHIYTTPSNAKYMRLSFKYADSDITDVDTLYLIKGTQTHNYIPYGKYGLEVKTIGKNLFDGVLEQGSVNSQGINNTNTTRLRTKNYISVYPNTTYALKVNENTTGKNLQFSISYYDKNDYTTYRLSYLNWTTSNPITFTTPNDCHYIRFLIAYTDSSTINTTDNISKIQVEKGITTTPYEPYIGHTNLITLNEPLRAIGNYKDKLYIDNGMLYVERKIGSVVLNGTEIWETASNSYYTSILKNVIADTPVTTKKLGYSNYFEVAGFNYRNDNNLWFHSNKNLQIKNTNYPNLNDWKTWLSTHNTEVNYILAKSIIESYELDVQPMIFESLGYGILSDVVSDSLITEELNGSYILEFEYMKNGKFSEFLVEENIIKAHGEPFSIYSVKKDTDERIKILAKHWVLNEWNKDFILDSAPTDLVAQSALNWIQERSINHSNILITGDCDSIASARYVRKNMIDAIFKEDNSILNRFGGELSYNKNNVTINKHRGNSAGITIRQGKNITGAEYYLDFSTVTTRLVPVGKDGLMLNDIYVDSPLIDKYATPIIRKVDVDTDSTEELENYCNQLFESGIDKPTVSIKIDFIELSKTTEYKNYSSLETAHLGDTVIAYIPSLNLNISTRVVKVVYNDNLQRITSLELGSITQNIATSNVNFERKMQKQIDLLVASDSSVLEEARQNATDLINHPFGGHIYIDENSGNMYIMDTTDINTAQNIWRWGLGGLGFSSTGINGPYGVAMTQDGKIVADYITAGVLSANVISSMNLNLTSKNISISSTNFTVSPDGTINAKNGKFSGSVEIEGDKPNYSNDDDADLYVHYHELEEDVEGFDGTGEIETTNESKVFSNGVFLQSKYNNSVPGSTSNTNGLDRVSQLNIDSYSSYEPVVIRRFFRDSNDNISGESNSIMKYGGFEAHDVATGDFSVIGSEMVLTDPNNKSITISPNSIPTPVLSNWYSTTATTLTGAKNHKLLVILARPGSSSAIMSLIIPTDCLTTSNQEFQVADESNYVSFNIKYSGSNILISGASRSNYGSIISAWTML